MFSGNPNNPRESTGYVESVMKQTELQVVKGFFKVVGVTPTDQQADTAYAAFRRVLSCAEERKHAGRTPPSPYEC